jgi:hypothetical protein
MTLLCLSIDRVCQAGDSLEMAVRFSFRLTGHGAIEDEAAQ